MLSRGRIRHKASDLPAMKAKNLLTGHITVYSKYVTPPRVVVDADVITSTVDGYAEICRDSVHPEFLNRNVPRSTYKGRNPKPRAQYSDKYIDVGDFGGDLSIYRMNSLNYIQGSGVYEYLHPNGSRETYTGGFRAAGWPTDGTGWHLNASDWPTAGVSGYLSGEVGSAASLGPSAWNKFKPKLSTADLGVFLGEIREVGPMLKTTARLFHDIYRGMVSRRPGLTMSRKASDHWLNTQFGWKPFLNDLRKFYSTSLKATELLAKAQRQNGHFVRRGGSMSSKQTVLAFDVGGTSGKFDPLYQQSIIRGGTSHIKVEQFEDVWFVGMFRYWVPSLESSSEPLSKIANYLRLYGLSINPSLVWNLTPWSWLADWVSNVGDNISNFTTAQDQNLMAKYAYIMKTTSLTLTNQSHIPIYTGMNGSVRQDVDCEWIRTSVIKTRRHASPFGFATDWPNFTARQWSILGALGMMRMH